MRLSNVHTAYIITKAFVMLVFVYCICSNEEISTRFKQLDKDGNGMLSQEEVSAVLQQLMGFDKSMACYLVEMFDTNHDGHLDKTEFIQMWSGMFGR